MLAIFEDELQKGTGFAYLLIKNSILTPSEAVDKILFENLATDLAYDPQCEDFRHEYIYSMLQFYPRKHQIYEMALDRFDKMTDDNYGEYQIFGFVEKLVKESLVAKVKLYDKFLFYASKDLRPSMPGVNELMLADGMEGLCFLAKYFGKHMTEEHIPDFVGHPFYEVYSEKISLSPQEVIKLLTEKHDPDIDKYLSIISSDNPRLPRERARESLSEIIELLRNGKKLFKVRRWLKNASLDETRELSRLFQDEKNLKVRKQWISVFYHTKIEVPFSLLVSEFSKTRDIVYREALIEAMLKFDDASVLKLCDQAYSDAFRVTWIRAYAALYNNNHEWRFRLMLEEMDHNEIHQVIEPILQSEALASSSIYPKLLWILYRNNRCPLRRLDIGNKNLEGCDYE